MVSVVQLHPSSAAGALDALAEGLAAADRARLAQALAFAEPVYAGQVLSTGEPTWPHALGLAANLAAIGLDAPGRIAGLLFAAPKYVEPDLYKRIAGMLDEKRLEREQYIRRAIGVLTRELEAAGVKGEIYGRPKHIYSIWNKMRTKSLDFSQVYDVRALRVIVPSIKDCYTALGVVHNLWQPIPKEFDDYISRPN